MSTISKSVILVNPDVPEAKKLRSWYTNIRYATVALWNFYDSRAYMSALAHRYESEGKDASMDSVGSGSSPTSNNGIRSVYTDRVPLAHITSDQSLGETKVFW